MSHKVDNLWIHFYPQKTDLESTLIVHGHKVTVLPVEECTQRHSLLEQIRLCWCSRQSSCLPLIKLPAFHKVVCSLIRLYSTSNTFLWLGSCIHWCLRALRCEKRKAFLWIVCGTTKRLPPKFNKSSFVMELKIRWRFFYLPVNLEQ